MGFLFVSNEIHVEAKLQRFHSSSLDLAQGRASHTQKSNYNAIHLHHWLVGKCGLLPLSTHISENMSSLLTDATVLNREHYRGGFLSNAHVEFNDLSDQQVLFLLFMKKGRKMYFCILLFFFLNNYLPWSFLLFTFTFCNLKMHRQETAKRPLRTSLAFLSSTPLFIFLAAILWGMTEDTVSPGTCQEWGLGDTESSLVNWSASHHQLAGNAIW